MHEGLKVDPVTGFDEGPRLGRWLPSVRQLTLSFLVAYVLTSFVLRRLFPWLMPLYVCVLCGAIALVLGLEARALAPCPGVDTSASRQLRWERAVVFGCFGLLATLGCVVMMFVSLTPGEPSTFARVALGSGGAVGLAALLSGVRLAWRHRPARVVRAEHPSTAERR